MNSTWEEHPTVIGTLGSIILLLAPLKLYAIHRELKWQSEEMRTQTRLLSQVANAAGTA